MKMIDLDILSSAIGELYMKVIKFKYLVIFA